MFGFLRFWTSCTVTSCTVRRGMISSSLRLRRKERKGIPGWGFFFFFFFTSDQTRSRKFARRPFFVIRAAQIRKPLNATNAIFVNLSTSNFPSDIHTLRRPGVVNRYVLGFLVPSPVPLRAPTKLPAYPSSPTPIRATGALVSTSPPASEQAEGSLSHGFNPFT